MHGTLLPQGRNEKQTLGGFLGELFIYLFIYFFKGYVYMVLVDPPPVRDSRKGPGCRLFVFLCTSGLAQLATGCELGDLIRLSPRIAIYFSLLSSVPIFSMLHSSILLISPFHTSRSSLYIHILPICEFYSLLLLPQGHICLCIFFLLPSTTGIPLRSFW